ncbi:GNAT family N-acetyltransferase [Legionella anisa]|uniref:GNAT family N-acetyltransferase n=1 Tax=Legionella anisa TaxID=28082 RepID=UPI00104185DD|nr:GNAT family N-acetyltransferase [Legionella anisa]
MQLEDKAILSTWLTYLNSLKSGSSAEPMLANDSKALIAITGIREHLYNSVFINTPNSDEALTQELLCLQQEVNLPLAVWISTLTQSPTIEAYLKQKLTSPGAFLGMLLEVDKAKTTPCPNEITIVQITTEGQAEEYATLFCEVFNFPSIYERTISWVIQQIKDQERFGYSFFAQVNGQIAGVSTLMIDKNFQQFKTGGLYNACVLPKFRKYGVGTAMACHRVNVARELGLDCLSILLMSDAMARGYCERLGFNAYSTMTPFYIAS